MILFISDFEEIVVTYFLMRMLCSDCEGTVIAEFLDNYIYI